MPTLERCTSTAEWFLNSGIQENGGGVARYFLSDLEVNAPVSTEITGYYASALLALDKQTAQSGYTDAALKAVRFLVDVAWDEASSAMPFECAPDSRKYSYFFDVGIIVRGLLAVWREYGHPDLLAMASKCGDSMAQDFFDGKGFSPVIELPAKAPLPYEPTRWSRSPGCYQLKAALAWYELWQTTNKERYLDLYQKVLGTSLVTHDLFLPGCDTDTGVMDRLHAYCYFLEGLLPSVDQMDSANALAAGIERTANFVKRISPEFLRSDVIAQLLRARLFADNLGILPLDETAAQQEASTLRGFQSQDSDRRLQGGMWFGRKKDKMLHFMNPVSTAFGYQALQMWNQYQAGDRRLKWQLLI